MESVFNGFTGKIKNDGRGDSDSKCIQICRNRRDSYLFEAAEDIKCSKGKGTRKSIFIVIIAFSV